MKKKRPQTGGLEGYPEETSHPWNSETIVDDPPVVKPNQGSAVEFFPAVAVMQLGDTALQITAYTNVSLASKAD